MFYHGEQAIYWYGCPDSAHMSFHPSTLLLVTVIEEACKEGYRWFDLVGPNQHLKGVQHFKEGFASEPLRYNAY